jgi:hypothetical protein
MHPAVHSAEVPEEHEHDGPVAPQVAEPMLGTIGVGQPKPSQALEIHHHLPAIGPMPPGR